MDTTIDPTSNSTCLLLKKFSIFDQNASRSYLDNINEVIDGFNDSTSNELTAPILVTKKEMNQLDTSKSTEIAELNIDLSQVKLQTFTCTVCNLNFDDRNDQAQHYKCDLHLYNIKQKLKFKPAVSSEEFEELIDISSISASDTDEDDNDDEDDDDDDDDDDDNNLMNDKNSDYHQIARSRPKISFRLKDKSVIVLYRCILHGKKNFDSLFPDINSDNNVINQEILIKNVQSVNSTDSWCIILISAGHFAAAIFKGDTVIQHKTFHRYVVRAKRGTAQSRHDSKGGQAHSTGANIRRSQEAHFKDDIRQLIGVEWKDEIDKCKCIFLRVPKYNRQIVVSSNSSNNNKDANKRTFNNKDQRLRHIPFMTFRPTFNEIKRTHTLLSKVEVYGKKKRLIKLSLTLKSPAFHKMDIFQECFKFNLTKILVILKECLTSKGQ
jgi:hypothetical protein